MVYFWNINRLKTDLANRRISKKQTLSYLICILSVQTVSWVFAFSTAEVSNLWDDIDTSGFFLFLIIGTVYCYHENGGRKGSDFLSRYISLAWVSGMRYTIMVIMPSVLFLAIVISLFTDVPDKTQWYDALFYAVIRVAYYILLAGHIRDVAMKRVLSEQEISALEEEYEKDFDQSKYPSILRRYLATGIDAAFILTVFIEIVYLLQGYNKIDSRIGIGIGIIILFFYEPILTSRLCTIGQKITGVRVRMTNSVERISILNACLRTVVKMFLGFLSFFSIPVTRKRRALHDFAAGSMVIYANRE